MGFITLYQNSLGRVYYIYLHIYLYMSRYKSYNREHDTTYVEYGPDSGHHRSNQRKNMG